MELKKNKIVFLDRDGTINYLRCNYVKNIHEFKLLPNVAKYLSKLSKANFRLVIVTNQSAINRGLLNRSELNKIHNFLISELSKENCHIDSIKFCPHRPDENCDCRKPKTRLFEEIIEEFSPVDLQNSWIIGDSDKDIQAGKKLGINYIKINSNDSLESPSNHILKNHPETN